MGADANGGRQAYKADAGQTFCDRNKSNRKKTKTKLSKDSEILQQFAKYASKSKTSLQTALDSFNSSREEKIPVSLKTLYKYLRMKMFKLRKECLHFWKASKTKKGHPTAKRLQKGKIYLNGLLTLIIVLNLATGKAT